MPPLRGSKNVYQCLTQGLRPGLCRSIALAGLISVRASYLLKWVHVLIWGSMLRSFCWEMCPKCTKGDKWCPTFVLVAGKQVGLLLPASYPLETVARSPKGQVKHVLWRALQNAVIARHRDWGRREFTHVNDQAWMSKITQRVPYYAMVSVYTKFYYIIIY